VKAESGSTDSGSTGGERDGDAGGCVGGGCPQNVHVLRGVGMGLDERAIAAVKQYKFKPAMQGGRPVAVELNVEVDFQIF
jgi:outer membrane biosynthesis protein TonB